MLRVNFHSAHLLAVKLLLSSLNNMNDSVGGSIVSMHYKK